MQQVYTYTIVHIPNNATGIHLQYSALPHQATGIHYTVYLHTMYILYLYTAHTSTCNRYTYTSAYRTSPSNRHTVLTLHNVCSYTAPAYCTLHQQIHSHLRKRTSKIFCWLSCALRYCRNLASLITVLHYTDWNHCGDFRGVIDMRKRIAWHKWRLHTIILSISVENAQLFSHQR
jgi:hypothetical protein